MTSYVSDADHIGDLEASAAEIVARATCVPVPVDPTRSIAILADDAIGFADDDAALRVRLRHHGLGDALDEIRRGRASHPGRLPAIVVVREYARVMWLRVSAMSRGGDA